jgi:hypothetical protein
METDFRHQKNNIAGMAASMTEGEPAGTEMKEFPNNIHWLTGTAPRGGQGVWMFSLM